MAEPTQTRHPWRAVARTILAAVPAAIGLLLMLNDIAKQAGIAQIGWVAGALAVVGTITRVLAMPAVNEWLRRWIPGLAAQPRAADSGRPPEFR